MSAVRAGEAYPVEIEPAAGVRFPRLGWFPAQALTAAAHVGLWEGPPAGDVIFRRRSPVSDEVLRRPAGDDEAAAYLPQGRGRRGRPASSSRPPSTAIDVTPDLNFQLPPTQGRLPTRWVVSGHLQPLLHQSRQGNRSGPESDIRYTCASARAVSNAPGPSALGPARRLRGDSTHCLRITYGRSVLGARGAGGAVGSA